MGTANVTEQISSSFPKHSSAGCDIVAASGSEIQIPYGCFTIGDVLLLNIWAINWNSISLDRSL